MRPKNLTVLKTVQGLTTSQRSPLRSRILTIASAAALVFGLSACSGSCCPEDETDSPGASAPVTGTTVELTERTAIDIRGVQTSLIYAKEIDGVLSAKFMYGEFGNTQEVTLNVGDSVEVPGIGKLTLVDVHINHTNPDHDGGGNQAVFQLEQE